MIAKNPLLIDKITLENFQSLRERVEIPIRPLTFLFGPNSAGKSGVYDSLKFLDAFFKSDGSTIEALFKRWAHQKAAAVGENLNRIEVVKIEVQFLCYEFLYGGGTSELGDMAGVPDEYWDSSVLSDMVSESNGPYELRLSLIPSGFQTIRDGYVSPFLLAAYDLTVSVRGLKIMRLSAPDDVYEVEFYSSAFGDMFDRMAERHGVSRSDTGLYKAQCWPHNFGRGLELQDDADSNAYQRDLVRIANHVIGCFSQSSFLPTIVSSDRTTISNSELSYIYNAPFCREGFPLKFLKAPIAAVENYRNPKVGVMKAIAESKFRKDYYEKQSSELMKDYDSLIDFINRSLSHHLFLDQGYQIVFDVCEIIPPDGVSVEKDRYVALLVAYLLDSSGRRLTFEDVGTGVSCVVPVIVGIYDSQSFIQQPELHLHPALQSSLGDIFVESVNREVAGRHLIETHSDYLILRCLRRIRETTSGRIAANSSLKLTPNMVSILYFDPQLDGTTSVKSIRVSTQGDFLDRWPRGFFEERGKDIFDE
jgi:hypothetical protein